MMRLILARHGETDWNLNKRYLSFTDIALNKRGLRQAEELSIRLSKEKIYKVYSSDMKRAFDFARIVFKDMPIKRLTALREMNFGVFEGLTHGEIMDNYPEIYRKWLDNPLDITIPGGESLVSLAKRARGVLAEILSQNKNTKAVVVFTHAGPIRVILCDILKLGLKEIWRTKAGLASVNIIEFINGKGRILTK